MVTRSSLVGQADLRRQIFVRGETVYQCDVCKREVRVPTSKYSTEVIQRCIITKNCLGKLHKVIITADANEVPAIPPAVPGVADWAQRRVFYLHDQTLDNLVWNIEHNLANRPSVQVFITQLQDGEEVLVETDEFELHVIDLNTVEVHFTTPQKGQAQCLAYSSANTVNPQVGVPTVLEQETILLTNNSEITIATLDSSTLIDFTITYRTPNVPDGILNVEYVGVDNQPSINSPWAGADRVYVNGRSYTVRSFSITEHPLAPSAFGSRLVADGTQFYFSSFSTLPGQNLILLGTSPFAVVDRIVDRYVDIGLVNQEQPELAYAAGEAYAAPSLIRSAYPLIHVVD